MSVCIITCIHEILELYLANIIYCMDVMILVSAQNNNYYAQVLLNNVAACAIPNMVLHCKEFT